MGKDTRPMRARGSFDAAEGFDETSLNCRTGAKMFCRGMVPEDWRERLGGGRAKLNYTYK